MGFFHMSFSQDSNDPIQPFNVLWSPASLPHSTTLSLALIFMIIQTSPCLINTSFDHCCCWPHTSTRTLWKRSFSLAAGSFETRSCYVHHFGKQGQVQGNQRPNLTEHWVQLLAQLCNDSQLVHYLPNSTIQHSLPQSSTPVGLIYLATAIISEMNAHVYLQQIACLLYQQLKRLGFSRHIPLIRTRWKTQHIESCSLVKVYSLLTRLPCRFSSVKHPPSLSRATLLPVKHPLPVSVPWNFQSGDSVCN